MKDKQLGESFGIDAKIESFFVLNPAALDKVSGSSTVVTLMLFTVDIVKVFSIPWRGR